MNTNSDFLSSGDEQLRSLLREARPAADLPPGFANAVWRRLDLAESAVNAPSPVDWLDQAVAWLLRPRLALAAVATLMLIGATLGARAGLGLSQQAAQARYLAAVSPLTATP
jgi:hypothetical protein